MKTKDHEGYSQLSVLPKDCWRQRSVLQLGKKLVEGLVQYGYCYGRKFLLNKTLRKLATGYGIGTVTYVKGRLSLSKEGLPAVLVLPAVSILFTVCCKHRRW